MGGWGWWSSSDIHSAKKATVTRPQHCCHSLWRQWRERERRGGGKVLSFSFLCLHTFCLLLMSCGGDAVLAFSPPSIRHASIHARVHACIHPSIQGMHACHSSILLSSSYLPVQTITAATADICHVQEQAPLISHTCTSEHVRAHKHTRRHRHSVILQDMAITVCWL